MQTVSKDFFCSVSVHCILCKDRSTSKAKHLGIVKELHYTFVTLSEMTSMTLIKYHDNARVTYGFYLITIPCLADGCIELLDGGNDNLGITMQSFYKFVRIIRTVYRTRLKCFIFRLGLRIEVMTVNNKHNFIDVIQFGNELSSLE